MKKNRLSKVLAIVMLIVCAFNVQAKKVEGSGVVKKETRKVESFNAISCYGVVDVFLSQGEKESVVVEADDNLLEYIITEIKNGTLEIKNKKNIQFRKSTKMNIYITVQNITNMAFYGVGDLKCETKLNLSNLEITNHGVGDINLIGQAKFLKVSNSGVGDIKAYEFVVEKLTLNNSGVGDVEVNATNELKVVNSGVGDVIYKGGANSTDIESNGVGSIKKR